VAECDARFLEDGEDIEFMTAADAGLVERVDDGPGCDQSLFGICRLVEASMADGEGKAA
jgi:hypothetical protein